MAFAVRASSRAFKDLVAEGEELFEVVFDVLDVAGDDVGDIGEESEVDTGVSRFATLGRSCQTSSAVKLRMGAMSRVRASAMRQRAVCALRRPGWLGAKV